MAQSAFIKLADILRSRRGGFSRLSKVMAAAVVSRAAQLAVVSLIARQLAPANYGMFNFAIGTAVISGMLGNLGWQFSFNRFYAISRRKADLGELHGLMLASNRFNLLGGALAAVILVIASFAAGRLTYGLWAAAVLTIPCAITLLRRQQLAGTGKAAFALLLDQGFASAGLLVVVLFVHLTLTEMLAVYTAAMIVGNLVATVLVYRGLPPGTRDAKPQYDLRTWLRVSLTLMQSRTAALLLSRLDVVLLSTLASLTAAGLYGAALRVTYVLTFPQFVLQTINGPQFAEAFAAGQMDRVRRTLKLSIAFALITSVPPLVVLLAFPEQVMVLLFGSKYASGAMALAFTSIGLFAAGLYTPFTAILTMASRERELTLLNLAVTGASVAASFWLMPRYGATGAAVVTMVSYVALLGGQVWLSLPAIRRS